MKHVKMLGLAAVAAAALMAVVGSSTASATVLCETEGTGPPTGTTCAPAWAMAAEEEIHAINVGVVKLTTTFKTIECVESTLAGHLTNEGTSTEPVKIVVTTLFFGSCNCEVKVLSGGTLEVQWIEGTHNGTIASKGAEVTASCNTIIGAVHCVYSTGPGTHLGTATGSSSLKDATATMDIEANLPSLTTNVACGEKPKWDGTYAITTPDTLNVAGRT